MSSPGFDADLFLTAQERDFRTAVTEIRDGRKSSHWMWHVFPQIAGIPELHGHRSSPTSRLYALPDLGAACSYLAEPVLGGRYVEILRAAVRHITASGTPQFGAVTALFGSVDAAKFVSSLTLFERAAAHAAGSDGTSVIDLAHEVFGSGDVRRCSDTESILGAATR
ncbi:MAG: hypothetical protein RLZZ305_718 [Actinomycetota bacterium]|jgi:uncharacterized protein (DUF1810 family)